MVLINSTNSLRPSTQPTTQSRQYKLIMPCNRRNHPALGFHPFPAESLIAALLEQASSEELVPAWSQNKIRNQESEKAHTLRMDVPGVKADRITIEEKNGEVEVTALRMRGEEVANVYQEVFYLNPFQFEFENAKATLTNGVLTLRIPKKEYSNRLVQVESAPVPHDLEDSVFVHSLDLPGVAATGLEVRIVQDRVHLKGKRYLGDKRICVQRTFDVPPSMSSIQARALLQDGVFTFLAPVPSRTLEDQGCLRRIWVEEGEAEMEVAASVATMKLSENGNENDTEISKKDGIDESMKDVDANVETVGDDEADERKETDSWEEIRSAEESK